MSAVLLGKAWRARLGSVNRKIILLRLVDAADDAGGNIYPSIATIANATELSKRTVQTTLRRFEHEQLLRVVSHRKGGRGQATRYALDLGKLDSLALEKGEDIAAPFDGQKGESIVAPIEPEKGAEILAPINPERVQLATLKGANGDIKGAGALHPNPYRPLIETSEGYISPPNGASSKPKVSKKATASAIEADFEEQFWRHYPRKVAKGAALKAYRTARKKTDAATILAGVMRYAAAESDNDPKYTAYPASWLNQVRWLDEAAPAFRNPSPQNKTSLARLALGDDA